MKKTKQTGFTLIELMIVVAIVGILAAIAYPSYIDSVRKSNRADAKASLNDAAQQMQRCYTLNNSFSDCSASGTKASAEKYYSIKVEVTNGGAGYTATATPAKAPQTGDSECASFTLNHLGQRQATPDSNGRCW